MPEDECGEFGSREEEKWGSEDQTGGTRVVSGKLGQRSRVAGKCIVTGTELYTVYLLLIWEDCYYEPMPCSALPRNSGIENSELDFEEWEACWVSSEAQTPRVGVRADDKVPSLVNKMMSGNRVQVVGQGLVGRAAFTGNHMWILSENYITESHPPEVQNEVCQQFSAGIKTIAIIPILPHGVVQLGSSLSIMENMAFVNDVRSLIFQLGGVPGALLSDNYTSGEPVPKIGVPVFHKRSVSASPSGNYEVEDSVPSVAGSCNQQSIPSHAMEFVGQPSYSIVRLMQNNLHGTSTGIKLNFPFISQFENVETGAEVIPLNPDLLLNHQASLYNKSGFDEQPCAGPSYANYSNLRIMEEQILSDAILQEHVNNSSSTSSDIIMSQQRTNGGLSSSGGQLRSGARNHQRSILNSCSLPTAHRSASIDISCMRLAGSGPNAGSSNTEVAASDSTDHLTSNHLLLRSSDFRHHSKNDNCSQFEVARRKERIENDLFQSIDIPLAHLDERTKLSENISGFDHDSQKHDYSTESPRSKNAKTENKCVQPSSGDDLFDILGVDFKSKLINDSWNNFLNGGPDTSTRTSNKNNFTSLNLQDADADLYSVNGGNSDCGLFSMSGTDHLLDAVVNGVHTASKQSSDDNVSCRTTLTKISNSSVLNAYPSYGRVSVSDRMHGKLSGLSESLAKLAPVGSCSFKSECTKEEAGNYSQTSSICGSQISSWVEQSHSMKHNSSASIAHPKRPDEVSKSNRKRLKPGENPRPRPKDRQMIQDRMKELREIVPNGAKCSIDTLLERTIKHMLFLQSVTKHADKLKQNGVSKVLNKDSGPLLKDNFEGGRTWACEVGSQSMVFPIIVEDLNPPRQMLVEMLCEERGLFLEIADIIRGLGLTILKGVMETRNDKVWACFAVEANRDVTRMEIFISLIQLLEQTVKSSAAAASGNGIENDNMIVHPSFQRAASIPATGRPHSLQ